MINIINEIKYLKNYEKLSVNFKNHNKFRLLINEINGISAWYSSIPLYRDKDGSLLNDFWELNEDCSVFRGINAEKERNIFRERKVKVNLYHKKIHQRKC